MKLFYSFSYLILLLATVGSKAFASETNEVAENDASQKTCSWEDRHNCIESDGRTAYVDPNLKPMIVDLDGDGQPEDTFYAYVEPDFATYYNATPGTIRPKETHFRGLFAKFINLSKNPVRVYWVPTNRRNPEPSYISDITAFGAAATASYPTHRFIVTELRNVKNIHTTFDVVSSKSLYSYDPYGSVEAASNVLTEEELELYKLQYYNLAFDKMYQHKTGRQWLGLYPKKHKPRYPMWPADSFGQTHVITTEHTQVLELPPDDFAKKAVGHYGTTSEQREALRAYQSKENGGIMTMEMKVISVSPRAFVIDNFLSPAEVDHILELATGMNLKQSTTKAGTIGSGRTDDSTRTSRNSWLSRGRSPIMDLIFRRAADVLQIDEACFRYRKDEEKHLVPGSKESITERLQLVHYDVGQQYTPHHDFAVPDLKEGQASRFATMLLYLNDEGLNGGQTSFPRWLNADTEEILKVQPKLGKAILFYNQLPDGNYDERSQHAAMPVIQGEKWLTNLWVWDPYMFGQGAEE